MFSYVPVHVQERKTIKVKKQKHFEIKGTVSVISSDPICKDGNARIMWFLHKHDLRIFTARNIGIEYF